MHLPEDKMQSRNKLLFCCFWLKATEKHFSEMIQLVERSDSSKVTKHKHGEKKSHAYSTLDLRKIHWWWSRHILKTLVRCCDHLFNRADVSMLLWLPVSDGTVYKVSGTSGGMVAIFPISHTVNNSTFNIKTDSLHGVRVLRGLGVTMLMNYWSLFLSTLVSGL